MAATQVHDCMMESRIDNPYVAITLLDVDIKCRGLLYAGQDFDELEMNAKCPPDAFILCALDFEELEMNLRGR